MLSVCVDLPDGIACEDDSPCTNEKPYCLKPKLKKEGVCVYVDLVSLMHLVPAMVFEAVRMMCSRART